MHQFARYLFREYLQSTFFMSCALVGAVWLTHSLKYIDFVMERGVSIFSFIKLILFILPNLVSIILPFSFFISVLFVLNKFYNDRELIVFQSLGLSNYDLSKPVLKLAGFICIIIYALNFYFYPLANQFYRTSKNDIQNNITTAILTPGEFVTFKKMVFYINKKVNNNYMSGLLVYDQRQSDRPVTIVAEKAQVTEIKNGLRFILINGNRQEIDRNNQLSLISFDVYNLDFINTVSSENKKNKPNEYFINELFNPPQDIDQDMRNKLKFEGHQRIILPLIVIPLALLALCMFLIGGFNRKGRHKKIVLALMGALSIEIIVISGLNIARKYPFILTGIYIFIILNILLLAGLLFYKEWHLFRIDRKKQ